MGKKQRNILIENIAGREKIEEYSDKNIAGKIEEYSDKKYRRKNRRIF